jgi:hypothetical protein
MTVARHTSLELELLRQYNREMEAMEEVDEAADTPLPSSEDED